MSRPVVAAVLVACALLASSVAAARGASDATLRFDLKSARGQTRVGENTTLRLKLKNRADVAREVTFEVFDETAPLAPFATRTVRLEPREKRTERVPYTVPDDFVGTRLRVSARVGELQDGAKVKVRIGRLTEEQWLRARALYRSKCARCHGRTGADVRGDSVARWIQAMRGGPGSMPVYSTSNADILLMRAYTRRPKRP